MKAEKKTVGFTISATAKRRGVVTPYALMRLTLLDYHTCYNLWHNKQRRVDNRTLARLCETLKCEIKDLLAYLPTRQFAVRQTVKRGKKAVGNKGQR